MEFIASLKMVFSAVAQLILLGAAGFVLTKKNIIPVQTLQVLSRILMNLFFPCFIFSELINNFNFAGFKHWWLYPILSGLFIAIAFALAYISLPKVKDFRERREYLASVTFSNSGYLPLVLIAALFNSAQASRLFIYLFLYLLGFNAIIWSFGVGLLVGHKQEQRNLSQFFSAPVIAILAGLIAVFFNASSWMPSAVVKSMGMFGACTLPLAMIVVGGNLSLIETHNFLRNKELQAAVFMKLILVPLVALFLVLLLRLEPTARFLLLLEAAMPTAVSLSVICNTFNLKGEFANQAIFWTHIGLIVTLPFFLIIFKAAASWF
jgi:predicted permease